jgi:hypothetical protein
VAVQPLLASLSGRGVGDFASTMVEGNASHVSSQSVERRNHHSYKMLRCDSAISTPAGQRCEWGIACAMIGQELYSVELHNHIADKVL